MKHWPNFHTVLNLPVVRLWLSLMCKPNHRACASWQQSIVWSHTIMTHADTQGQNKTQVKIRHICLRGPDLLSLPESLGWDFMRSETNFSDSVEDWRPQASSGERERWREIKCVTVASLPDAHVCISKTTSCDLLNPSWTFFLKWRKVAKPCGYFTLNQTLPPDRVCFTFPL